MQIKIQPLKSILTNKFNSMKRIITLILITLFVSSCADKSAAFRPQMFP